jgi:hypothetical protein
MKGRGEKTHQKFFKIGTLATACCHVTCENINSGVIVC